MGVGMTCVGVHASCEEFCNHGVCVADSCAFCDGLEIERLEAKVEELEDAARARPMSDAPKEGPGVLAWTGPEYGYLIVMWSGSRWLAPDHVNAAMTPQHWHPLPSEPKQNGVSKSLEDSDDSRMKVDGA